MDDLLAGACKPLVEKTESDLSVTVKAQIDNELQVGSKALIQDMKRTDELIILLKPGRQDYQYLIAQGCIAALASRKERFTLRGNKAGQAQFETVLQERGLKNASSIVKHLSDGTGNQLRGAPLLALSAQEIYNDYPALHDDQLKYFKLDCAEGAYALTQAPEEFAGVLVNAHLAMNGASALVADYLFQKTEFYKPYVGTETDALSTSLVEDLYGINALTSEKDIVMSWIDKLSLNDFYQVVAD